MRKIRILSLVMALLLLLPLFAACNNDKTPDDNNKVVDNDPANTPDDDNNPDEDDQPSEFVHVQGTKVHEDYTSVYEKIGSQVTIDMVEEDPMTGCATVTVDGKTYELGMDFLSMAMVYNMTVPEGYDSVDDVYNEWWKLYIQRWNYLVPEVPLYSNQYFDLFNAKIENFVTSPYWATADAIVAANVKEGEDNSVILGSNTDLSGAFRNSSWGKSSPGSSDLDVQNLTTGYSTAMSDKEGAYGWNMMALAEVPTSVLNEDGTLTYTMKIRDDLVFSDGTPITAKNYVASILANSTPVAVAAGGTGISGLSYAGYKAFKAYDGTNADAEDVDRYFKGVQLLDDYTFAVTIIEDYAQYYYSIVYGAFSPDPLALYLGDADVIVNENNECGLSDEFYAMTTVDGVETYAMVATINANLKWNSALPYSGPYTVADYDESTLTATLKLNPNYPGDDARGTASIETITYIKVVSETQMDKFTAGEVDVIAGITGGDDTKAALKLVEDEPEKFAETHYDRAGYGKLAFRCDLGPTNFVEVRQAIIYTINRPEFAATFTGGFGAVVNGPYYTGAAAYIANEDKINLNPYTYSSANANRVLDEAGWVYNAKGEAYVAGTDAVRYKKLEGPYLTEANKAYATTDGAYATVEINGEYYMPLAINWFGTQPNNVTDLLLTAWQTNPASTTDIGMYIVYTSTDFSSGLYGEYLQIPEYGWDGVAKCTAINFATGFTSAVYDQSFYWTIDQDMYEDYSNNYLMDEADFWENY